MESDTIHKQKQQSLNEKQSAEFGPTLQGWIYGKQLQDSYRTKSLLTNDQVQFCIHVISDF